MFFLSEGETIECSQSISLLLPYYLDGIFRWTLEKIGFSVIHSCNKDVLEKAIRTAHIDIALEWQHGQEDYPIRDLFRKYNKDVPMLLCLNWNGLLPPDFPSMGYQDYLDVPWTIAELMRKCCRVLPESKKPALNVLWKRRKKN